MNVDHFGFHHFLRYGKTNAHTLHAHLHFCRQLLRLPSEGVYVLLPWFFHDTNTVIKWKLCQIQLYDVRDSRLLRNLEVFFSFFFCFSNVGYIMLDTFIQQSARTGLLGISVVILCPFFFLCGMFFPTEHAPAGQTLYLPGNTFSMFLNVS